eukprot:254662-Pelagomonas_calceolata.AAC.10
MDSNAKAASLLGKQHRVEMNSNAKATSNIDEQHHVKMSSNTKASSLSPPNEPLHEGHLTWYHVLTVHATAAFLALSSSSALNYYSSAASTPLVPLREGDLTWEAFLPLTVHATAAFLALSSSSALTYISSAASTPLVPLREGDLTWEAFLQPPNQHSQPDQPTSPASLPRHPPAPHQSHLSSMRSQPEEPAWPGWLHWAGAADACNILFSSGTTVSLISVRVLAKLLGLFCAFYKWERFGFFSCGTKVSLVWKDSGGYGLGWGNACSTGAFSPAIGTNLFLGH